MLHSEARAKSQRSIHTINQNTKVIDTIEPRSLFPEAVQVRRMLSRTHGDSQHFIVTLLSDIQRAKDVVKPFAELAIRGDKLRFTVKPTKQYPDMRVSEEVLRLIEKSVAAFMQKNFHAKVCVSDEIAKDSKREWHLL